MDAHCQLFNPVRYGRIFWYQITTQMRWLRIFLECAPGGFFLPQMHWISWDFYRIFIRVIFLVVCNTICVKSYYIWINWAGWFDIMVLVVNQFASTPNTVILTICCSIISYLPSAAYMHQWIWSALVQIMAWCLLGAKSLSKPGLSYWQLDPK